VHSAPILIKPSVFDLLRAPPSPSRVPASAVISLLLLCSMPVQHPLQMISRDLYIQVTVGAASGSDAEKCLFVGRDVADVKACAKRSFSNVLDRLDGFQLCVSTSSDPSNGGCVLKNAVAILPSMGSSEDNPLYLHKKQHKGQIFCSLSCYVQS
jgi:hypothetical protein